MIIHIQLPAPHLILDLSQPGALTAFAAICRNAQPVREGFNFDTNQKALVPVEGAHIERLTLPIMSAEVVEESYRRHCAAERKAVETAA